MAKTLVTAKTSTAARSKATDKVSKGILVRINVEGWRELRKLAAENDETIQGVMIEAINSYLLANGHPPVAKNPLK